MSCIRCANQESDTTKLSMSRHFVQRQPLCTRLGTQPVHTKGTLETASHPWQRPVTCAGGLCLCLCTMDLLCLDDWMLPGDFTLLVRPCIAIWICIPAEQEDSNMVMSTQWYAKNNVSNIFIYTYITGQPSDVEGSSIGRRGVEGLTIRHRGVEGSRRRGA